MITRLDSSEALLFFNVATNPPEDGVDWSRGATDGLVVQWDRMIALALVENAITVLNSRVATLPSSAIPAEVRERIGRLALVWTFKLGILEKRLIQSVRILAEAGIEATLLKGAALALTHYRGFTDRPMADIDLLVHPSEAGRAHRLMQSAGWAHDNPQHPSGAWNDHHHLPPLSDTSGSGLRLEIHVAPLATGHLFRLRHEDMLDGSTTVELGGVRVRVPEPHMHAVHAAIHFAWSHRFTGGRLNIFRDLAALHSSGSLSWDTLISTAHRTRSQASCYWTLRLARRLTDLPVPSDVLADVTPQLTRRTLSVLERHITQLVLRSDNACPSVVLRDRLWALALGVKKPDRIEPAAWEAQPATSTTLAGGPFRRVGAQILRVPRWSRYVASLLPPTFEVHA